MLVVSEQTCREVVGPAEAFTAVEKVFAAMAKGDAQQQQIAQKIKLLQAQVAANNPMLRADASLTTPTAPGSGLSAPAPAAPGTPAPAPAQVSVTAPNGQVITFPNQQAADAFKKAAGIR